MKMSKKVLFGFGMLSSLITVGLIVGVFYVIEPLLLENFAVGVGYNIIIDRNADDDYAYMISKLCELKKSEESKIYCVYNFFRSVSRYDYQDKINSLNFTLTNSSDCKNAVVFYCAVFKNLNISCQPNRIEGHTFATVQFDEGYCNIDQKFIDCKYLGD